MSEFRQDIINKNWVLIAQGRQKRPTDFHTYAAGPPELPEVSAKCVFCPGHEQETGDAIAQYEKGGKWLVRVVTNKYEAVEHILGKRSEDFYLSRPGIGDHEV